MRPVSRPGWKWGSSPLTSLVRVVLPLPDGPVSTTSSPAAIRSERSATGSGRPGYSKRTPSKAIDPFMGDAAPAQRAMRRGPATAAAVNARQTNMKAASVGRIRLT